MDELKAIPPVFHPALELQAGFASVGVLDAVGQPWLVLSDGDTFKKCDPKEFVRNGHVVPAPLAYKGLRSRWPDDDLSSFLASPTRAGFRETVEQVRGTLLYYLEFASPDHATLCACWDCRDICSPGVHDLPTTQLSRRTWVGQDQGPPDHRRPSLQRPALHRSHARESLSTNRGTSLHPVLGRNGRARRVGPQGDLQHPQCRLQGWRDSAPN
jgi:hypothetical protein